MAIKYLFFFTLSFLIFVQSQRVFAEGGVFLNEFTVDPLPQNVEIINTSTQSADLSNWYIDDNGGTTYYTIPANTVIQPNACMVFSSEFNLNKSSADALRLFDTTAPPTSSSARLIDSFSYTTAPAVNMSYLRPTDGAGPWITSIPSIGKFNATQQTCVIPSPTPTLTPTATPTQTPTSTPLPTPTMPLQSIPSPSATVENVYISEVMTDPPTGANEWVELYNNNDKEVMLENWYIDDIENGGSSPKSFSLSIPAKSFATVDLTSSMFNNSGDSIRLLDNNKNEREHLEYNESKKGTTFGKIVLTEDSLCLQEPSKNAGNNPCIVISPTATQPEATNIPTQVSIKPVGVKTTVPKKISTEENNLKEEVDKSSYPTVTAVTPEQDVSEELDNPEVLGAMTSNEEEQPEKSPLVNSLSFSSFSFSLVSLLSMILRIKMQISG